MLDRAPYVIYCDFSAIIADLFGTTFSPQKDHSKVIF